MDRPHIIKNIKEFLKEGRSYYYYSELDATDCEDIINYVERLEKSLDKACEILEARDIEKSDKEGTKITLKHWWKEWLMKNAV